MTTIVGYRTENKVYMGADSLASEDSNGFKELRKDPKVFINGEYLIGFSGSYRTGQILMHSIKYPTPPKSDKTLYKFMVTTFIDVIVDSFEDKGAIKDKSTDRILETECAFLVGIRNRLFCVDIDFQVAEPYHNYTAIGSGREFAIGAIGILDNYSDSTPEDKILEALKITEKNNSQTSGPFIVLNT